MKNHNHKNIDINELWFECAKRSIQYEPLILTALEQLRINRYDQQCLSIVLERINSLDQQEVLHPEPFRKTNPTYNLSGKIRLGQIMHSGRIWNINSSVLCTHVIAVGRTGGGKSSYIKLIIKQLLERNEL